MCARKKNGAKAGQSDRSSRDAGARVAEKRAARNRSWDHGDKGQGREGLSKGYGGSEGEGTGPSGPDHQKKR